MASANETVAAFSTLSNSLAAAVEQVGTSIVAVQARRRVPSTGVCWRQGVIVTADHTIDREDGITVQLPDGRSVAATLAGRDPGTDLAVLRIEEGALSVAPVKEQLPRVGQLVLAVGRPGAAGLSASSGVISAVGGPWQTWFGGEVDAFIRPDLTLYPGFSGGPLVDGNAQVAGINTSGLSRSMTLTIPASTVERVVEGLLTSGHIARGYIGLSMQPVQLPEQLRTSLQLEQQTGLLVVSIASDGPGQKAGILVGDILIALGDRPLQDTDDVQRLLGPSSVGKDLQAKVIRGGQPTEVAIMVAERPRRER